MSDLDRHKELRALRNELADMKNLRDAARMALAVIDRHHRALAGMGWTPPEEESAIVAAVRRELG